MTSEQPNCECMTQLWTDPCEVHGFRRPRGIRIKLGMIPGYHGKEQYWVEGSGNQLQLDNDSQTKAQIWAEVEELGNG